MADTLIQMKLSFDVCKSFNVKQRVVATTESNCDVTHVMCDGHVFFWPVQLLLPFPIRYSHNAPQCFLVASFAHLALSACTMHHQETQLLTVSHQLHTNERFLSSFSLSFHQHFVPQIQTKPYCYYFHY